MATVTIGKTYFEALLRRAEFHTDVSPDPRPADSLVTLTQAEHEYLRRREQEYANLRKALFHGGITSETLDILIAGVASEVCEDEDLTLTSWGRGSFDRQPGCSVPVTRPNAKLWTPDPSEKILGNDALLSYHHPNFGRANSFEAADMSIISPDNLDQCMRRSAPCGQNFNDRRTVLFTNLPDKVTHKDLTGIIRGGRLLEIFMRNDRSATVSFVEGASEFLRYAKRHDFYLHTKRIEVRWNERQFHIPAHVTNKLSMGATRNIVIRNGTSKNLTDHSIREDLEHIHNLVVISVTIHKGDVYISTNSVHNALFARTCMMSRLLYKGLKIDWYPDECADPLPRIEGKMNIPASAGPNTKQRSQVSSSNIFSLLDLDETEVSENSSQVDGIESQAAPGFCPSLIGTSWADDVVLA